MIIEELVKCLFHNVSFIGKVLKFFAYLHQHNAKFSLSNKYTFLFSS